MSTVNFLLATPDFNQPSWHDQVNNSFISIDALLQLLLSSADFRGIWINSQAYAVNDYAVDSVTGEVYKCKVSHTSASSGAFSVDRAANPTFWEVFDYKLEKVLKENVLLTPSATLASQTFPTSTDLIGSSNFFNTKTEDDVGWTLNTGNIVVPAGITEMEIRVQLYMDVGTTSEFKIYVMVGAVPVAGHSHVALNAQTAARLTFTTGVISVTPGDLITLKGLDLGGGLTDVDLIHPTSVIGISRYSRSYLQILSHYN